jgi:hypothetical protein
VNVDSKLKMLEINVKNVFRSVLYRDSRIMMGL